MDWNIAISIGGAMFVAFALVLGRSKTVLLMLSSYVALAIASEAGILVSGMVERVQENSSLAVVKSAVFVAVVLFVALKGELGADPEISSRGSSATVMTLVYGFLTAVLIISSIMGFFPEGVLETIKSDSSIAAKIYALKIWWLMLPVIVMIGASFFRKPTGK